MNLNVTASHRTSTDNKILHPPLNRKGSSPLQTGAFKKTDAPLKNSTQNLVSVVKHLQSTAKDYKEQFEGINKLKSSLLQKTSIAQSFDFVSYLGKGFKSAIQNASNLMKFIMHKSTNAVHGLMHTTTVNNPLHQQTSKTPSVESSTRNDSVISVYPEHLGRPLTLHEIIEGASNGSDML
jgi:hypothetical protein